MSKEEKLLHAVRTAVIYLESLEVLNDDEQALLEQLSEALK